MNAGSGSGKMVALKNERQFKKKEMP